MALRVEMLTSYLLTVGDNTPNRATSPDNFRTNRSTGALWHEDPLWVAACPTLLGTFRRSHTAGMKSKVHPTYKTKYRVANWPAYNQALVRRGDVTVWLSWEAITTWTPRRSGRRGG